MDKKTNLKDTAKNYSPNKNISDLEIINIEELIVEDREGTDPKTNETYKYKVGIFEGEEYRIPWVVLANIKTIIEAKPTLKKIQVIKKGEGRNTKYTVIPLD